MDLVVVQLNKKLKIKRVLKFFNFFIGEIEKEGTEKLVIVDSVVDDMGVR